MRTMRDILLAANAAFFGMNCGFLIVGAAGNTTLFAFSAGTNLVVAIWMCAVPTIAE